VPQGSRANARFWARARRAAEANDSSAFLYGTLGVEKRSHPTLDHPEIVHVEGSRAAKDRARVAARRGEDVDQSRIAVKTYLEEWLAGHAATVKHKTWIGYRNDLRLYVIPRIGSMRLQALRPATISKLYAEFAKSGGKDGRLLAVPTVQHVHRSLRKGLNDAVMIDAVMSSNPTLKAKLPREGYREPRWSGRLRTLRSSWRRRADGVFRFRLRSGSPRARGRLCARTRPRRCRACVGRRGHR
jgi:Phage integrase, N-terminal SAM-like domain